MDLQLRDKVAIITGAGRGIGLAIATALAEEGARVVAASLTLGDDVNQLAERFTVLPVAVDLAAPDGPRHVVDYSAAKAAVTNLTRVVAEEFTAKGVRVNAVAPGPVSTEAWIGPGGVAEAIAQASGSARETVVAQAARMNNMTIGRMVAPEDVAALVLFLASDRAAAITGAEYLIDGGMVKTT